MDNWSTRIRRNATIAASILVVALVFAMRPDWLDRPLAHFLNGFANKVIPLDQMAFAFYWYLSLNSALLMSVIWYCWFRIDNPTKRSRILVGTVMALVAAVISRIGQYTLPTHLRPVYDSVLAYQKPSTLEAIKLNTWNSFPSDHSTLLAGLLVTIWIARAPFRTALILLMIVIETSRVYMGAHYPSDLVGGAALASLVVWTTQSSFFIRWGEKVVALEERNRGLFYLCAYYFCFQMITYFGDLRSFAGILLNLSRWL